MCRLITDAGNVNRPQNPKVNSNIFEILTFSWMFNLFKKGQKIDLKENDLYTILNDHKSSLLGNELEKKWELELIMASNYKRNPSLLRTLIDIFGCKVLFLGLLFAIDEIILKMIQPFLIGGILSYFNHNDPNNNDIQFAYICASGLVCNILISVFLYHYAQMENVHCGMKIRVGCCSLIFRKALRLSHSALVETTMGQMINLLSNDVSRFDPALTVFHYLWIGPLQTIIVTYFLWKEIGISSLFGISTFFVFIPLQVWLAKKISEYRLKTAIRTDKRLRLMNELISGIQVIKMYTWEKPFANLINYARKSEIRIVRGSTFIRTMLSTFRPIQIRLQLFISIISYILLGNNISVQKVFIISAFYNIVGLTMGIFFSRGMEHLAEIIISIKRIQTFLLLEEKDSKAPKTVINNVKIMMTKNNDIIERNIDFQNYTNAIVVSNATAKWTNNETVNTIENINLIVKSGGLVAIIGQVGAGKSSLIHAILNELPLSNGKISVRGVVSYTSQEPWLFGGSIQKNILFGLPMDQKRYEQVIQSCALNVDFEKLPYGDKTIVGDRGINLSGGQRTRINLARAVYKEADIYLLDDPLSAVDTRVGKHIFENCIEGFLKGKTCILITHQIQCLTNVKQIVLMENGKILTEGNYQDLQTTVFDFAKLLKSSNFETNSDFINENINFKEIVSINENKLNSNLEEPKGEAEICSSGNISNNVYISYFLAGGSICKIIFFFSMFFFTQVLVTGGDYWISYWINQEENIIYNEYKVTMDNGTSMVHDSSITLISSLNFRQMCIMVYSIIMILLIVVWLIRNAMTVSVCMNACINLHDRMFKVITRTTMLFFKTNSSGRIFNRFSKDMGAIDDFLPKVLIEYFQILMLVIGIIFVVGLVNIYLMIPTFFIGLIFYYIRIYYLKMSQSLKRLEGVTRSPVFAHLNSSIQGLTTIRAHGAEKYLTNKFDKYQDFHSSAWFLFISSNEAFGLWLDLICLIYISIVTLSFLSINKNAYSGNVGLVITQIITLSGMVQWGLRQSTILENQMTSVERVLEYTNLPAEDNFHSSPDKIPPKEWPDKGQIVFKNFNMRYSQNTPLVLKNLNFKIYSMEKVGIVGRTGAGKSSLIAALFRLAINDGNIIIDDIDIHELGLQDLRSKIAIIPQEPVLFSGTIRTNLDPFDEYSDHILWNALEKVELREIVEDLSEGLNSKMSEGGSNFSVGQKQLICLARAIVRNNKIIIMDEATANVDPKTDAMIQNTIKNKFQRCTVITIAHRLNTIMDSDKVLVMDAGIIVEFDHPNILLKNKNGYFYKLVAQTGRASANLLHNIAEENFKTMQITR